ncbi:MAG: hypothetical protein KC501_29380 [Myxococcales bacterium]|nr:hypothetical protein [Myxococcales bacterium]
MDRRRPIVDRATVALAMLLGVLLGSWPRVAEAAPSSPCPYGFNSDGTCREEPTTTPSRPSPQRITFRTEPPGAAIFIDGQPLLRKDGTQAVTDYTHRQRIEPKLTLVELRKDGFEPAKIWARIERNGRQVIAHELVPLVPIKVHNLSEVACDLEVERVDEPGAAAPDEPIRATSPDSVRSVPPAWVSLRRRVFPARTTITVELAGPGRYELGCSAVDHLPQCKTVELRLEAGSWVIEQRDGCGAQASGPARRDGSLELRLPPRPACVRIDSRVPELALELWTTTPELGCDEPPAETTRRQGGQAHEACDDERREDGLGGVEPTLVEYGARVGDLVCARVPALPTRPPTAIEVDATSTAVGLLLYSAEQDPPEIVELTHAQANEASRRCRDEDLPAPQRARSCAHLAFLLYEGRFDEQARPDSLTRKAWRELRRSNVTNIEPAQLWARACEQGDARACEAAALRPPACEAVDGPCPTAEQWLARACEGGRPSACLRGAAPLWASWPGLEQLYRFSDEHPLRRPSSTTSRSRSKYLGPSPFAYPAIQLGFDPRDLARSWQLQASWLNLFRRTDQGRVGVWLKGLAPTLVSFEQRVQEGDTARTRRVYGGMLTVEAIGRLYAELARKRPTEVLLFASLGLGGSLGWVDGLRTTGDALGGLGLSVGGWGLDLGVRTLRAPYVRTELDGEVLRSSWPRLGVYLSLETNLDLRRRRR